MVLKVVQEFLMITVCDDAGILTILKKMLDFDDFEADAGLFGDPRDACKADSHAG